MKLNKQIGAFKNHDSMLHTYECRHSYVLTLLVIDSTIDPNPTRIPQHTHMHSLFYRSLSYRSNCKIGGVFFLC